jgi:DNA-binding GntR family transcriptional regulator
MVTLTPRERRSAGQRVADDLRRKILQAEDGLLPGVLLPPESRMAMQYGVSRPTMRQALAILRDEELVVTVVGQGSKVIRPPMPEPDVTELAAVNDEVARFLRLAPGTLVIRRRQIFYEDGQPVRLVLNYSREPVA